MPDKCHWNGPERGDDNDKYFLADNRTGASKTEESDKEEIYVRPRAKEKPSRGRSSSRSETRVRRRSRSPRSRPRVVLKSTACDKKKGKGEKDRQQNKSSSSKDKFPAKHGPARSVDNLNNPNGRGKFLPVDNDAELSDDTVAWHARVIEGVPQVFNGDGTWKDNAFQFLGLHGVDNHELRSEFFGHVFDHLKDLGKEKNKRIYIGPGRDGSSSDKISIDCKFDPQNTKVTSSRAW